MQKRATVLLIAKQGRVRDGLRALLCAIPEVDVVDQPCDGAFSADLMAEHNPALVLVSCSLHEKGTWNALKHMRARRPKVRFLVLVDDVKQQQLAWNTGADQVLIKGTSAEKLAETVKQLLSQEAE